MQRIVPFVAIAGLAFAVPAAAQIKLVNKDSKSHDVTIKCSSTAQSSIGGNSTRDIGKGPCTVSLKGGGSASASGKGELVIKDGKIK